MPVLDINPRQTNDTASTTSAAATSSAPAAGVASADSAEDTRAPYGYSVPACVSLCMARGNTAGCTGATDYGCLCSNEVYQNSVALCWRISCTESDYHYGLSYSAMACSAYGITPQALATGTSNPIAVNTMLAPVVYSRAAWNIQAVMSSVCSVVLVVALTFGILNCRNQMRREQLATSTRWTNVLSNDSKRGQVTSGPQSFSQMMRSGPGSSSRWAPGPLDSILETDSRFTLSFPAHTFSHTSSLRPSINRPYRGVSGERKFTNRMTEQEWEMRELKGMGSDEGPTIEEGALLPVPGQVVVRGDSVGSSSGSGSGSGSGSPTTPTSPSRKGKEKEVDVGQGTIAIGDPHRDNNSVHSITFSEVPATPTTAHLTSEYGSTTNLRKVAGET